jgi:hypothetical protein
MLRAILFVKTVQGLTNKGYTHWQSVQAASHEEILFYFARWLKSLISCCTA